MVFTEIETPCRIETAVRPHSFQLVGGTRKPALSQRWSKPRTCNRVCPRLPRRPPSREKDIPTRSV